MPTIRFRGQEINSLTPALDARNVDQLFVVGGRNFSFDSKGPKTDFGDRIMMFKPFKNAADMHGTRIAGRTFVHTPYALYEYDTAVETWIPQFFFHDITAYGFAGTRWGAAFLNRMIVLAHPVYGYLRCSTLTPDSSQVFVQFDSDSVPGIPDAPLGIVETNGRLVVLTQTAVSWSGPSDVLDWTPELGGAGAQVLAERVGGDPLAITAHANGFIVWTTSGALLGEFIGGDGVWRFTGLLASNRPQNSFCTARLNQDETLFLTQQGLFSSKNGAVPEAVQAPFNEFLRDYMARNPKAQGRLDYDELQDRWYIQLRTHHEIYSRTYVLTPTLQRWGEFSEPLYGVMPITNDVFGYIGLDRLPRGWLETPTREILPSGQVDWLFPRIAGRSISITNEWCTFGTCVDRPIGNLIRDDFYNYGVDSPAITHVKGLDAEIIIGYFRPTQVDNTADGLIEVQELALGSYPQALPEDFAPGNLWYDYYIEHYSLLNQNQEDWEDEEDDLDDEDWNLGDSEEDFGGPYALLNRYGYGIQWLASVDGYTDIVTAPELARFDTKVSTFSCVSSGIMHKLKLTATAPGEAIHVRYVEVTLAYQGQLL